MSLVARHRERRQAAAEAAIDHGARLQSELVASATSIADAPVRVPVRLAGKVRSLRIQPLAGIPALECQLIDDTGAVSVLFCGRRAIAGVEPGTHMVVEGVLFATGGRLRMLNPLYTLLG